MSQILKLPWMAERVETGPIQFGNDWPGTFIRGDHAAHYAMYLQQLLDGRMSQADVIGTAVLRGLLSDLQSSRVSGTAWVADGKP